MKNLLFVLLLASLSFQTYSQTQKTTVNDCPPVPWVTAQFITTDTLEVTWDKPCDTCENTKYKIGEVDWFDPCKGELPDEGTLTILGTTKSLSYKRKINQSWYGAFAIKAIYDTCQSDWTNSNPVFHNMYSFDTTYSLIVNLSLEDGGNPQGAEIILNGANCFYEGLSYDEQADSEGVGLFEEVDRGNYSITVSKAGYHTAVIEDFYLNQDSTINVELKVFHVGLQENSDSGMITVFPNPATNQLTIESAENIETIYAVNQLGQTILVKTIGAKQTVLNTSGIENGMYLLRAKTEKGEFYKKIFISK